jgi:hypothetical protein
MRGSVGAGAGLRQQYLQCRRTSAEGGVIGNRKVKAKKADDGADQPFRLAQGQLKHSPECQSGRDCDGVDA